MAMRRARAGLRSVVRSVRARSTVEGRADACASVDRPAAAATPAAALAQVLYQLIRPGGPFDPRTYKPAARPAPPAPTVSQPVRLRWRGQRGVASAPARPA